jgi:hypothetical protein
MPVHKGHDVCFIQDTMISSTDVADCRGGSCALATAEGGALAGSIGGLHSYLMTCLCSLERGALPISCFGISAITNTRPSRNAWPERMRTADLTVAAGRATRKSRALNGRSLKDQ